MNKLVMHAIALASRVAILVSASTSLCSFGQDVDFERDVRPIISARCGECHGPSRQEADLRLDARRFAIDNRVSNPIIIAGDSSHSPLMERLESRDADFQMPPEGPRLEPQEIDRIREWIDQGAKWVVSQAELDATNDPRLKHWAWQPVTRPAVPFVLDDKWSVNAIDRFILNALRSHSLSPSPDASRAEFIRRVTIDLHGLPPSFEDVRAFEADSSPDATERLVDRLLASPRYGERWAQHWLDIAHYADTHGFERDQKRDNAWRYRDYVIQSLNHDKRYDDFLKEQIAGDAISPDCEEAIVATGYLAAGPWDFVGQAETPSPQIKRLARADDLDDMVTQVMTSTCGLTVHCARCHNHKIDPISQREYYQLVALFSGAKRGDRDADPIEVRQIQQRRTKLDTQLDALRSRVAHYENHGLSLADIVGGGDGHGNATRGNAIHILTGRPQKEFLDFVAGAVPNRFVEVEGPWIDGVVVPDGSDLQGVPISSSGLRAIRVPATSGQVWDAIRNGPVNAQRSTKIGQIDFQSEGHSVLGMHANAAITWDLGPFRDSLQSSQLVFEAEIGYGGRPEGSQSVGADVRIFVDAMAVMEFERIHPASSRVAVSLPMGADAKFLTLMATDGGDGIGHDQVFFGDPRIRATALTITSEQQRELASAKEQIALLEMQIRELPKPKQVYAIRSEAPVTTRVMNRGNPEQLLDEVNPGAVSCLQMASAFATSNSDDDRSRRSWLASWVTSPTNPLMGRVLVNRLWHHHFGAGIVETPSDFGLAGAAPSHPELLDWLTSEFVAHNYSLKAMHRSICTSRTYRQSSRRGNAQAVVIDSNNRLLWRQNARRLEAEPLRDCILSACGTLSSTMDGPGFQDFEYQEEYAPIYRYTVPVDAAQWRRSIYRFVVRTTPHPFLTPLDCPDPASLTPARSTTTTAVQALAMWNNGFVLAQAEHMARLVRESESSSLAQVQLAFRLAISRDPSEREWNRGVELAEQAGLSELCRALLNSNEFIHVD